MKANLFKRAALAVFAPLVYSVLVSSASGAPSPVGTWDCLLSGHRTGTAYFQFFDDGTFFVLETLVPNKPRVNETGEARNDGDADLRSGTHTPTVKPPLSQQLFGIGAVDGLWDFDNKGRIIGEF